MLIKRYPTSRPNEAFVGKFVSILGWTTGSVSFVIQHAQGDVCRQKTTRLETHYGPKPLPRLGELSTAEGASPLRRRRHTMHMFMTPMWTSTATTSWSRGGGRPPATIIPRLGFAPLSSCSGEERVDGSLKP